MHPFLCNKLVTYERHGRRDMQKSLHCVCQTVIHRNIIHVFLINMQSFHYFHSYAILVQISVLQINSAFSKWSNLAPIVYCCMVRRQIPNPCLVFGVDTKHNILVSLTRVRTRSVPNPNIDLYYAIVLVTIC